MIKVLIVLITFIIASIFSFLLGKNGLNKVLFYLQRVWTLFCFNALFWVAIYIIPLLSLSIPEQDKISTPSILLAIASIILPFLTIFIGNKIITYNKDIINVKYKNIMYGISALIGSISLIVFAFRNRNIKDSNADGILQYLIAPVGLLLGELFPLSCLYSNKGMKDAFEDNFIENYFFKGSLGWFVLVFSVFLNVFIAFIFNSEKVIHFIDNLSNIAFILSIGLALALSPIPYILYEKRNVNYRP